MNRNLHMDMHCIKPICPRNFHDCKIKNGSEIQDGCHFIKNGTLRINNGTLRINNYIYGDILSWEQQNRQQIQDGNNLKMSF